MLFQWDIGKDSPALIEELYWGNRKGAPEAANEAPGEPPVKKRRGRKKVQKDAPPVAPREIPKLDPEEEAVRSFAHELFSGAVSKALDLDSLIRRHAENWRLERMPVVDRNILRLAIFEMLHLPETPPAVVINEALEIARKFSEEESVAFINGMLDQVRKEMESVPPA